MPKYDNFELDLQITKESLSDSDYVKITSCNTCYSSNPVTGEIIGCDCL